MEKIQIDITILAPVEKVWNYFNEPEHVTQWNFAHESWQCTSSENDLRLGGKFKHRMEAKDGSFGFDFEGFYDEIIPYEKIKYHLNIMWMYLFLFLLVWTPLILENMIFKDGDSKKRFVINI